MRIKLQKIKPPSVPKLTRKEKLDIFYDVLISKTFTVKKCDINIDGVALISNFMWQMISEKLSSVVEGKTLPDDLRKAFAPRLTQRKAKVKGLSNGSQEMSLVVTPLGVETLVGGYDFIKNLDVRAIFDSVETTTGESSTLFNPAALVYEDEACVPHTIDGALVQEKKNKQLRFGSLEVELPSGINIMPEPTLWLGWSAFEARKSDFPRLWERFRGKRLAMELAELDRLRNSTCSPMLSPDGAILAPSAGVKAVGEHLRCFDSRTDVLRAPRELLELNVDGAQRVAARLQKKGATKADKREFAEFEAQKASRDDLGDAASPPNLHFGMSQMPIMFSNGPRLNSAQTELSRSYLHRFELPKADDDLLCGPTIPLRFCYFELAAAVPANKRKAMQERVNKLNKAADEDSSYIRCWIPIRHVLGPYVSTTSADVVQTSFETLTKVAGDIISTQPSSQSGTFLQPRKLSRAVTKAIKNDWITRNADGDASAPL